MMIPARLKVRIRSFLESHGLLDTGQGPLPLWKRDREFQDVYRETRLRTLVDEIRCYTLFSLARAVRKLRGSVAEVGVWRGGTARLLAHVFRTKPIFLFDTFAGLPPTDPDLDEGYREGMYAASKDDVAQALAAFPNVRITQGIFPGSAPAELASHSFCLVHVDVDLFQSAEDCCEYFYPRMVPGGVLVFDDYGFQSQGGVKEAVDRFLQLSPEQPVYLPSGQGVVTKLDRAQLDSPGGRS